MLFFRPPPLPRTGRPGGWLPNHSVKGWLVPALALPGAVCDTCRAQAALRPATCTAQELCPVPARVTRGEGRPPSPGDRRHAQVAGCVMHCGFEHALQGDGVAGCRGRAVLGELLPLPEAPCAGWARRNAWSCLTTDFGRPHEHWRLPRSLYCPVCLVRQSAEWRGDPR